MQNFSTLFIAFSLVIFAGCSTPDVAPKHTLPQTCDIYDMQQAACIDKEELVSRLAPYRVVFVGDDHASAKMHEALATLLDLLAKEGRHLMLANEWFTPEDDALLRSYSHGTFEGNFTKAVGWKAKAGYPFASYVPIYKSVQAADGTLYGINMDKAFQKAISESNASAMNPTQKAFYGRLDMNLTAHRALLLPFFSHCHARHADESEQSCAKRMYRVQVAWDSYMAQQSAKLAAMKLKTRSDLLVVFAGAMHLDYGLGINARFARLSREPFVTILPVPAGTPYADVGEADYLLFYPKKGTK